MIIFPFDFNLGRLIIRREICRNSLASANPRASISVHSSSALLHPLLQFQFQTILFSYSSDSSTLFFNYITSASTLQFYISCLPFLLPPSSTPSHPFYHRMARGSSQERKNISNNTSRSSNHIISVLNSPFTSASPSPEPHLVSSSTMVGRKNTMHRSPQAEVTLPVTYTPTTHRISKAKKGKRVHACEYPGCNKVCAR